MAWGVPDLSLGGQPGVSSSWADGILAARDDKRQRVQQEAMLQGRQSAITQAQQPDGTVNWSKAVQGLYQAGDIEGAQSAARMAQNEAEQNFKRERAGVEDRQWAQSHSLDQQRVAQAGNRRDADTPESRAMLAQQNGLEPGSPEFQRYVLTGSLPASDRGVTAGDREAIRDSDDMVQAGESTLTLFDRILGTEGKPGLNDQAYSGLGASKRAAVAANLPDWMVPDALAGGTKQQAEATLELDNTVMEQALGQMKQIFGGNPTEGERSVLLDLQGSATKPANVRREILQRGKALVQRRIAYNRDKAGDLRGGEYYKPTRGAAPQQPSQGAPSQAPTQRLRFNPATGDFE